MPISDTFKVMKATLTSMFSEPQAYSRRGRIPIYISDMGSEKTGFNPLYSNKILLNSQFPEQMDATIRHEAAHQLFKPIIDQIVASMPRNPDVEKGLTEAGYKTVPLLNNAAKQAVNESIGYGTEGQIPGLGPVQFRGIPTEASSYIRAIIDRVNKIDPNITKEYMNLVNPSMRQYVGR